MWPGGQIGLILVSLRRATYPQHHEKMSVPLVMALVMASVNGGSHAFEDTGHGVCGIGAAKRFVPDVSSA